MHPSLTADFVPPPPLKPQEVMGRNELCWCGSGKKWKRCHRDRQLQHEIPIGKLLKEVHVTEKVGSCLHPEASDQNCSNRIIKAHTIQRAGGLRTIAENGHVVSGKRGFEKIFKNDGELVPDLIGIGDASTFMGFCSFHDNSLFEPIESHAYSLDHEAAFLLAFRALAYEYLTKKNSIRSIELQREMDRGKDFPTQGAIQQSLHVFLAGSLRGLQDLRNWKSDYDQRFREKNYGSAPHYAVEFEGVLPFVCSGAFHPEVDFHGNRLQIISRGNATFEHVCVNVSAVGPKSFIAFGWTGAKGGPAERFVESFRAVTSSEKANAALILAVEQLENTYFTPSWWNALTASSRNHLIERMRSGIGFRSIRPNTTYQDVMKVLHGFDASNEIRGV